MNQHSDDAVANKLEANDPEPVVTDKMPEEEGAPPALFEHCVRTYKAMLAEAHVVIGQQTDLVEDEDGAPLPPEKQPDTNIVVYEGFLTQLITGKLNLSVPYYTHVRSALIRMGCMRQLRRGGGPSPSQWELIYEPTEEAFRKQMPTKVPKQSSEAAYEEQIRNLSKRVGDLEEQQKAIIDALEERFGSEEVTI